MRLRLYRLLYILFIIVLIGLYCPATYAGFSTSTNHCYGSATSGTTVNCTLGSAPITGNVVAVHFVSYVALTLNNISDGTTTYTLPTTHCSATNDTTAGTDCIAYLIPAITGGRTITATITGGTCSSCGITVDEFPVSGGTATFDKSAAGSGTGAVNSPTITPTGTSELFYAGCTDQNSCIGVGGTWTQEANGLGTFSELAEFNLSVSSSLAVNFTGTVGQTFDAMEMAFQFTPTATSKSSVAGASSLLGNSVIK